MSSPLRYFGNRKVGLALGSGGAKGLSHIAVVEYLEGMGIPIDMIAGSSIGAVIGALYSAGSLGRFKEDILKLTLRDMLAYVDPVVPRSGLIQGRGFVKFMERYIPRNAAIEDLKIPLAVLATDYASGGSVVFRSGNILEALRASVSIPGVLVPVKYKETLLVDGGVANPLPINVVQNMGAGITIAVNLHPQLKKRGFRNYMKERLAAPAVPVNPEEIEVLRGAGDLDIPLRGGSKWLRAIEKWIMSDRSPGGHGLPNIFDVITQTVDIMEYVNTMLMLKYDPPTVLIEPDVTDVMTLNFTEAGRVIREGHLACTRVKSLLKRKVMLWV